MKVFYIPDFFVTGVGYNALNKSRSDLNQIYTKLNFIPLTKEKVVLDDAKVKYFAPNTKILGEYVKRIINLIDEKCEKDDRLILDFPFSVNFSGYPKIISYAVSSGMKVILFIHDLDGVRFRNPFLNWLGASIMDMAYCLVSASQNMDEMLRNNFRVSETVHIVDYNYWDYLTDGNENTKEKALICFAGNLSKSTFLSEVPDVLIRQGFNLYGKGMKETYKGKWRGEYSPEKLTRKLDGKFGLVWDGKSSKTCSGSLGKYLRYNTSHKFGLYMATGKPVIVWKESAISDFVKKEDIGITVSSLYDIPYELSLLSQEDYLRMKRNVEHIRKGVITGEHLSSVILQALQ